MAPKSRSGVIRQSIGPIKAGLLRNISTADKVITTVQPEADVDTCQKLVDDITEIAAKLRTGIATLTTKDEQWQTLVVGLSEEEATPEEELYAKVALDSKDGYQVVLEYAKDIVCRLERKENETKRRLASLTAASAKAAEPAPAIAASTASIPQSTAKLPKLVLPSFNGDCLDWPNFWNIFSRNVHERNISPAEKFAYLQGQLTHVALDAIEGIAVTDANYDSAVAILRERFERSPSELIGSLYSQLKRIPKSSSKVADLTKTFDNCEKVFRQLENAGEHVDNNRSLVLDVLSKYPTPLVADLMQHHNVGKQSSLKEVRTALRLHIRKSEDFAELLQELNPFSNSGSTTTKDVKSSRQESSVANSSYETGKSESSLASSALAAVSPSRRPTKAVSSNPTSPCYFCGSRHFNSQCPAYDTADKRLARLRELKRCIRCLGEGHATSGCPMPNQRLRCFFCSGTGDHPSPLCPKKFGSPKQDNDASATPPRSSEQPKGLTALASETDGHATEQSSCLPTAVAIAVGPAFGTELPTRILFDTGSHRSYITEDCARSLKLSTVRDEAVKVAVFGTTRTFSVPSRVVSFSIKQHDDTTKDICAYTTPVITNSSIPPAKILPADKALIEKMGYVMAESTDSCNGAVDILIGSDLFWEFVNGPKVETSTGLFLIPTTLGYVLGGRFPSEPTSSTTSLLCLTETYSNNTRLGCGLEAEKNPHGRVQPDMEEFWALDKIGITDDPVVKDDDIALQKFNDTVYFDCGRYHVQWPWKPVSHKLPTNYDLALGRFRSLSKRLRADSETLTKYNEVIMQQLRDGIIERVPDCEVHCTDTTVHYLPHHPVIKLTSATTKVRIVYDASARTRRDNPSLNECLYRGPVLLPDLCAVLLRFRLHTIAVVADIEKAFLQICLQPMDRDVTRFLWFEDPSNSALDGNIVVYRFCRVPFGIISSPFLLSGTIQFHLKRQSGWVAQQIEPNMYVDNLLTGCETEEEAQQIYNEARELFLAAGMNLQEWCSSSSILMSGIPTHYCSKQRSVKVLGMLWDSENDTLKLNQSSASLPEKLTKRIVLQAVASLYDPLGLFQPVFIRAKWFLQRLWQKKLPWDQPLSVEDHHEMEQIYNDLAPVFEMPLPRNPSVGTDKDVTDIVVFCDASKIAYMAAVYVRKWNGALGKFVASLVYAKGRLAPVKKGGEISLPRLELLGVTIGARAGCFVRKALMLPRVVPIHIFTDSQCVLFWRQETKPLSVFVGNRVRELNSIPDVEFRYVKTSENPADLGTRGVGARDIQGCSLWWTGPEWLSLPLERWDNDFSFISQPPNIASSEFRKGSVVHHTLCAGNAPKLPLGIDPSRYSSFLKLKRVTTWCLKFLKRVIWLKLNDDAPLRFPGVATLFNDISDEPYITRLESTRSKIVWVKNVQEQYFGDVKRCLEDGGHQQTKRRKHHLIRQLGIGIDSEGVLRCYGRFQHADLPDEAMEPKLLPKCSVITTLIIRDTHERLLHSGVAHTLSQVRREFWVPKGRMAVRTEIKRCLLCRKYTGGSCRLPLMPPWPRERMSPSSPFRYTGLDYLGPITIKVGSQTQKAWVCLFTCLAVRAIHLEWVVDCSAKEFLSCLTRFISRRGTPERIISDNAPQFRVVKDALDRVWHSVLTDGEVLSYAAEKNIQWTFITELAPWQGGFYERLVALVKRSFRFAIGRRLLQWNELATLCCEVESLLNTRPITYLHSDFDSGKPLRPIDFLTDLAVGTPESNQQLEIRDFGEAGRHLLQYWKFKQNKLRSLWEFWRSEYLLSLRERGSAHHRRRHGAVDVTPDVGDVLLVKDSDAPRGAWKLGRVTSINRSDDGAVQSAYVELPNKAVLRRSVDHLYPIELPIDNNEQRSDDDEQDFDGFTVEEVREAMRRVKTSAEARVN